MRRSSVAVFGCLAVVGAMMTMGVVLADDVIDNSVIAHLRLRDLHRAISIYQNDNEEQLDDPIHLVGYGDVTIESFWHPGDDDPAPLIIDNSLPNQPNSAQVSFIFRTGWLGELPGEDYLIWDASPANNAGRFISAITVDGTIETIPPVSLPYQSNVLIAQRHLFRIGSALKEYFYNNDGRLPDSLLELYPSHVISRPRSFWNPGDSDPMPAQIDNAAPNAVNSAYISFEFPAAGLVFDDLPLDTILLQDNSPENNLGLGVNVLYKKGLLNLSGGMQFVISGLAGDTNGDEYIDLMDWAKFQRCYTGWSWRAVILDDTCRVLDFNGNGKIEYDDLDMFIVSMDGPG